MLALFIITARYTLALPFVYAIFAAATGCHTLLITLTPDAYAFGFDMPPHCYAIV